MWDGFIGRRVAAATNTLRRVGLVCLIILVILGLASARKWMNVTQGPLLLDDTQLASIHNPSLLLRDYVKVQGRETDSTGLTEVETMKRNGVVESQTTTSEYMVVIVGHRLLIAKTKPNAKADTYTGTLVSLPEDLKSRLFADINDPELRAAILPLMLDATGQYDESLWLYFAGVVIFFVFSVWTLVQARRRGENPELHPLCKALSKYGPLYTLIPEIDADYKNGFSVLGPATFTPNWVVCCSLTQSLAMRRNEIVWVYKKRTKHSVNFIPTGSTYSLIVRDARGKLLEISSSEQHVDNYLRSLAEQTPWVIFGFDRKIEKLYKKKREEFAEAVAQRRAAIISKTGESVHA